MTKGLSMRYNSYEDTLPKLLRLLKLDKELKKYHTIILKPTITQNKESSTSTEFLEPIIQFCIQNKNPIADIFIAEGADGVDTIEQFEEFGYNKLAEKYAIGLLDLNTAETEQIGSNDLLRFEQIKFPRHLRDSFLIVLPKLHEDSILGFHGALSSMLGAFPAKHYKGIFSKTKTKLYKWPIKYAIHDILQCKMPNLAITDASEHGFILAGQPLAVDKYSAKLLNIEWKTIPHIALIDEAILEQEE